MFTIKSTTAPNGNNTTTTTTTIDNTTNLTTTSNFTTTENETYNNHFSSQHSPMMDSNDNYIFDISMMRIADTTTDESNNSPAIKHQYSNESSSNDEFLDALSGSAIAETAEAEMEAAAASAASAASAAAADDDCLYLNGLEIDCNEEEQTISELVRASDECAVIETDQSNSMRVAFGIILRLVLPLTNGVLRGIKGIRDVRFLRVLRSVAVSRQALANLLAFTANTISMNLSSVQVSHRIEPILKLLKIRRASGGIESLPDTNSIATTPTTPTLSSSPTSLYSPFIREPSGSMPCLPATTKRKTPVPEHTAAPKCCTLNVLAEPPAGSPIRADIVFIHGLHGSLANTWKQGLWENERQPVVFDRPPKPPVRPPKRPRHSRSTPIHPPHKQKRARFAHADLPKPSTENDIHDGVVGEENSDVREGENCNEFSFVCGEPRDVQICDGIEYSFPTFRLRMNDNGRLLRADLESSINDENLHNNSDVPPNKGHATKNKKSKKKLTADDPNYSKCWPGDWLPLDCPGVRVIALNYTTDQYLWRPLWKNKEPRSSLIERSREMSELLIEHRVGYGHPIIWVGHSKGGLFIKQIIVDAWESGRPAMVPFWRSSKGVFFYSVPHRGSHLASIKAPLLSRSVELIDIEKGSKYLLDLHRRFVGLYHLGHLKIEVFSFVETALTLMSVLYLRIVGVDSADPGIGDVCGIRLDHREICKPRSRDCILYKELVKMINKVC